MKTYFLLSLIPVLFYLWLKMRKSLHMLQQNWYNDSNRYLRWILKHPYEVFINLDTFFVSFVVFMFMDFKLSCLIFGIFYIILFELSYMSRKKQQTKLPLKITARVKRLIGTTFLIYLIPILIMTLTFDESYLGYYYLWIGLMIYLNYFIVMVANVFNKPIEKQVFYHYKRMAVKKLKGMSSLEVIGITGSYGKTSSKSILNDILNVKYIATPTPKNFNTTYGLINSINNYLDKFSDYFIAEMGAFKKGEIKELCDLVHPKYGILTKIGTAHMETFGSQENIQTGKFELIESLPSDGVGILNRDDQLQVSYNLKSKCHIIWIGIDNKDADIYATNIKLSASGTTFDCYFKDLNKSYKFETKLLGHANIYNILAGIALSKYLGISMEQLQTGVKKVRMIEHRLELKQVGNLNIIDDAYNSNPVGSKMAVEVLGMMPGKKIVVTPGMIELGEKQYELNMEFGKYIADNADIVILIGKEQTKPIYEGLKYKKFSEKNIHILNDVKLAFPLIQQLKGKETYVLLENDLPDIFNER